MATYLFLYIPPIRIR